jgi:hypothetical protein
MLKHLDALQDGSETDIKKSVMLLMSKSGRALPIGTIHTGKNGVKYIKTPSGKWRRKYDRESRGLKVSVAAIKRQVNKAQTARELMNIVLEHRDRFSDAQGVSISVDDWESKTAGTPVNTITMVPRERPVYGIVGKHDQRPAIEYGNSSIIFKDSVRERTTYTIGNSSSEQGAFQNDVRAIFNKGRPVEQDNIPAFLLETKQVLRYVRTYMEAQIWGSADLTQDAEKIVIGDDDIDYIKQNEALWNKFKAKMKMAGVAIEDTKGNSL